MQSNSRVAIFVAVALLVTVASQIFYVGVVSGSENADVLRPATWFTELFAFALIAIGAQALASRSPVGALALGAVALGGIVNVIQVGMGLSMFAPAMEASEATPQLFSAILAGAFFFYFFGKILFGLAAIALGLALTETGSGAGKVIGVLAALSGAAAAGLNFYAMIVGREGTELAGASGTLAAALLAIVIILLRDRFTSPTA